MKKILLSLFVFGFFITMFIMKENNASASIQQSVDTNLSSISQKIGKDIALRTDVSYSSNPYDYIKDDKDFDGIVALGNDALPYLDKKLADSPHDGLQEYITAIAIEKIAKVDLKKNESSTWDTANKFSQKWKEHLSAIPGEVNKIANDTTLSAEAKSQQLSDLGTPAIPFILDKIQAGNEDLFPAVVELTKNTNLSPPSNVANKKEWATAHKDSFSNLKKYVLAQQ